MRNRVYLYAPAGGQIGDVTTDGAEAGVRRAQHGVRPVAFLTIDLAPGETKRLQYVVETGAGQRGRHQGALHASGRRNRRGALRRLCLRLSRSAASLSAISGFLANSSTPGSHLTSTVIGYLLGAVVRESGRELADQTTPEQLRACNATALPAGSSLAGRLVDHKDSPASKRWCRRPASTWRAWRAWT